MNSEVRDKRLANHHALVQLGKLLVDISKAKSQLAYLEAA